MNCLTMAARKSRSILQSSVLRGLTRPNDRLFPRFSKGAPFIPREVTDVNMTGDYSQSHRSAAGIVTKEVTVLKESCVKERSTELSLITLMAGKEMFGPKKNVKIGPVAESSMKEISTELNLWDEFEEHKEKIFEVLESIFPEKWKKTLITALDNLIGQKTVFRSHYVAGGSVQLTLTCGGFEAKDLNLIIDGRMMYVSGSANVAGLELEISKKYKLSRSFWFDPKDAKAYMQRGVLMIHLPRSPIKERKTGQYKVVIEDIE